jgi:glycosyltransferase involved in cell wall biosynthesis
MTCIISIRFVLRNKDIGKMPRISIIIPIYNVEQYLEQCLNSILNQTFKDIEIICVNDGSTDNSYNLLKEFAKKDNRIKIITQENKGVSTARNIGLDNSNSEFIMFLDSDDWYDKKLCEKVLNKIKETNADIICFGHNVINNDNTILTTNIKQITKLNKNYKSKKHTIRNQIFVWDKAFKRQLIEKYNTRFIEGLKCAEDIVFCLSLYYLNPCYSYIEEPLYNYRQFRTGNATSNNKNAIKNDFKSLKALVSTNLFKQQKLEIKKMSINHFIGGSIAYYKKFENSNSKMEILSDISELVKYIESIITPLQCYSLKNYRKLKKILWKSHKHWYFKIFNINTYEKTKDFIIFGHKITVNRGSKCQK